MAVSKDNRVEVRKSWSQCIRDENAGRLSAVFKKRCVMQTLKLGMGCVIVEKWSEAVMPGLNCSLTEYILHRLTLMTQG